MHDSLGHRSLSSLGQPNGHIKLTIKTNFNYENPKKTYNYFVWWERNEVLGTTTLKGTHLINHSLSV